MDGKRLTLRRLGRVGKRFAVVFGMTVGGVVAFSGIAAAASSPACSGRGPVACVAPSTHDRSVTTVPVDPVSITEPVVAPAKPDPASVAAPKVTTGSTAPAAKVTKGSPAPAVTASLGTPAASRADHKHKADGEDEDDTEADTEGDEDCGDDDSGDAPDADDDDEDCGGASPPTPEPCDDDADEDDDGEGDEGDEDECAPEPKPEVCDDDIDNDEDGDVDEDCVTPAPPETPVPPSGGTKPPSEVLPKKIDRLPTTGVGVTSLFLIGMALVALGGALRLHPRSPRLVFAGQGSAAELILVQYLQHVANQRPIRRLL